MTTTTDIKDLQDQVETLKEFPVKLSWKQVWIVATTIITIIGSSFGLGIKVQSSYMTIELNKQLTKFQTELSLKDFQLIEANRKLKETAEENIYLTNRYDAMKEKLQKCLDKSNFLFSGPSEKDNN